MSIEISPQTESRLAGEAQRLGISVEELLNRFIDEHAMMAHADTERPSLPVWHLGATQPLHRRDIYADVR